MFNNTTIFKHFQSRDHKMTSLSIRSIDSTFPAWAAMTGGNSLTPLPEPAT